MVPKNAQKKPKAKKNKTNKKKKKKNPNPQRLSFSFKLSFEFSPFKNKSWVCLSSFTLISVQFLCFFLPLSIALPLPLSISLSLTNSSSSLKYTSAQALYLSPSLLPPVFSLSLHLFLSIPVLSFVTVSGFLPIPPSFLPRMVFSLPFLWPPLSPSPPIPPLSLAFLLSLPSFPL